MELQPRLIDTATPASPAAVAIVLHGGGSRRGAMMVSPTQLSVLRMIPIARLVARRGRRRLAVLRLLNSHRGWDGRHTPVDDVRWALQQVRDRWGDLPIGLIGHSLGGRAALLAGVEKPVRSVVALAPFVYPEDAAVDLSGRQVLIVDGSLDRIARPELSAHLALTLAGRSDVGHVRVQGGKHAMLRHHRLFDGLAADFTTSVLLDRSDNDVVQRIRDGERSISLTP